MSYLMAILSIVALTQISVLWFKRKFEILLAPSIFLIILILYIFGLFNCLHYGFYFIFLILIFGLGASIFALARKKININGQNMITPGFFVFLIFVIIIFFGTRGRMLYWWDEFSHWGLVVKNMYINDTFGSLSQATTQFKAYPPAASLFQYFFTKFNGTLIECQMFRAMDIMLVSLVMPVFSRVNWKNWKNGIAIAIIVFVTPILFYADFYISIYVDALLGGIFAFVLYTYFSHNLHTKLDNIVIGMGLFILTLTKASGFGLALVALFIIYFDLLKARNFKWIFLVPAICTILAKVSWEIHLDIVEAGVPWNTSSITGQGILGIFNGNLLPYQTDVIGSFIQQVFTFQWDSTIKFAYFSWMIVWIGLTILLGRVNKLRKKQYYICGIGLSIGYVVYSISLLILYLFTYTEYEATNLASFQRYMNTYIFGATMILLMLLIKTILEGNFGRKYAVGVLCCIILFLVPLQTIAQFTIYTQKDIQITQKYRKSIEKSATFSEIMDPETDKIYLISQHNLGKEYWAIRYNCTPIWVPMRHAETSFSENVEDGSIVITVDEWEKKLREDYTYVYLHVVDDFFISEYAALFENRSEIQNDTLFRVDKSGPHIELIKVSD
ncbi:hypothetical protein [Gehongia tenuis]|uniref:Uncharacterized protein n=1 Tax=Gehongia tenuis TaxID=2763655 RepID=A0A926D524_9FIRM|nr:hypothetical protein [Gehongia tenuis]MBC8531401.1 hypothetical protein [Gehongia tenuis]